MWCELGVTKVCSQVGEFDLGVGRKGVNGALGKERRGAREIKCFAAV